MSLRAIPHLTVIRPADATETAVSWRVALENKGGPTALILTRQGVPTIDRAQARTSAAEGLTRGAYVLREADGGAAAARVILIGTGSEVDIALAAQDLLAQAGLAARVVSMPSWELFEAQPDSYRAQVLPPRIRFRVSVEAGVTFGWSRYVGPEGTAVGIDRFGASAPYQTIYREFGLTPEMVARAAHDLVA